MKLLYENQNIPEDLALLALYVKQTKELHDFFSVGFDGIKSNNYCGFLQVDNQDYFIAPKICEEKNENLDIFLYMLMYAYDIKLSYEHLANFENRKHKLFEIFIRYFSDRLLEEFKRGVFKRYVTIEENLKVLRGKYLIEKNFSNYYHQNIFCEYDEFSMDNDLNRFFLFAIKVFQKFSSYPNLNRCEMILDEVEALHVNINRHHINFDRVNQRYEQSYKLAMMLLKKLIPLTSNSKDESFAFLFDMGVVFEKFIGKIYKDIDSTTELQAEKNYGSLKLKPDIITKNTIIDTKYKKVKNREDLNSSDKYQMFVYGTNFEIKNTMLLYPKHLLHVEEDLKLGENEKMINLKMRTIDLYSEKKFEEYVKEIKKRLEELG
ncbi:MAG: restriction endonuclease [Epsilonproteobacteria bacterium]|nr:restriction endonuclease [Campylobacterota bacterium]